MAEKSAALLAVTVIRPTEVRASRGLWQDAGRILLRKPLAMFGAGILLVVTIMALIGPQIAPYDPDAMGFSERFASPSIHHLLGTDDFGRDILSRIIYGSRVSLEVGIISVSLAATVGSSLGLIAGYSNRV